MRKTKFDKMLDEIEKVCGKFWGAYDVDEEEYDENAVSIQCITEAEDDVKGIINNYGYEILEETDFCGSDWDGHNFIIKTEWRY